MKGRIYVLVGGQTFSAAFANAAALKHDGGERVLIVGAQIGDRLQWWSEGRQHVELSNSRYAFRLNAGYWDLLEGCVGKPRRYGDKYDVRVKSFTPQIATPVRVADWLAGRNPGMEAVLRDQHESGSKDRH